MSDGTKNDPRNQEVDGHEGMPAELIDTDHNEPGSQQSADTAELLDRDQWQRRGRDGMRMLAPLLQ